MLLDEEISQEELNELFAWRKAFAQEWWQYYKEQHNIKISKSKLKPVNFKRIGCLAGIIFAKTHDTEIAHDAIQWFAFFSQQYNIQCDPLSFEKQKKGCEKFEYKNYNGLFFETYRYEQYFNILLDMLRPKRDPIRYREPVLSLE